MQVRVTPETARAFKAMAVKTKRSSAELLRAIIERVLATEASPSERAWQGNGKSLTARLKTLVDEDTKAAWSARAKARGVTASDMLRGVIALVLQSSSAGLLEAAEENSGSKEEPKKVVRVPIGLHESELRLIDKRAEALGWRRSVWMLSVLQSAATGQSRATAEELETLRRSNSELRAIGRNLNQIAHALHKDDRYKQSITVEKLDTLRGIIDGHASKVQQVIAASEHRWAELESFRPETIRGES